MPAYRYTDEHTPPAAQQATDVAVTRFEHVYEVEQSLMEENVTQQTFPNWDTLRIVESRHDHLAWMHRHWADEVISGEAILREIATDERVHTSPPKPASRMPDQP